MVKFYQSVFGGHLVAVTHAYGTQNPAEADLVSWGQVQQRGASIGKPPNFPVLGRITRTATVRAIRE